MFSRQFLIGQEVVKFFHRYSFTNSLSPQNGSTPTNINLNSNNAKVKTNLRQIVRDNFLKTCTPRNTDKIHAAHYSSRAYTAFVAIGNWISHIFKKIVRFGFRLFHGTKGGKMPAISDPILLESASCLAKKIRKQELSSVQITQAFIKRIDKVNPLLNCMVDERFKDALLEAKAADDLIKSRKYTEEQLAEKKPFLGVAISTKDCIKVKGMLNTAGLYSRRNYHASEDADAIALMRNAGAIPFALTNVSEVCMWWESNNLVHGRTNNPYDTSRIAGGSSGGEGCMQAAAASPFGLGSDIGGSIRMSALFNGIFGHKPSQDIVSNEGQFPCAFTEEENSFLSIGPMVRHAEDLKPVLKIIAGKKAKLLNLDKPVDLCSLKYFYQENDGGGRHVSKVDRDIVDGINRVANHLKAKFKRPVEKIQIKEFRYATEMWLASMKNDSGYEHVHLLGNLKAPINPYKEMLKLPFEGEYTLVGLLTAILEKTQCRYGSAKYCELISKRNKLRTDVSNLLGNDGVLIYPTHPTVAPYHMEPIFRPYDFSYAGIVNILGFPVTSVPLGKLGREGLPIGVQIIANCNQDRLCLAVAEELERAFGGWVRPEIIEEV